MLDRQIPAKASMGPFTWLVGVPLAAAGAWIGYSALFVPHPRVAAEAARLGARETIVAGSVDREVARALIAYFRAAK